IALGAAVASITILALGVRVPQEVAVTGAGAAGIALIATAAWVGLAMLRLGPMTLGTYWGTLVGLIYCALCGLAVAAYHVYRAVPAGARPWEDRQRRMGVWWSTARLRAGRMPVVTWCLRHRAALTCGMLLIAAAAMLYFPARWAVALGVHPDAIEYASS